MQLLHFVKTTRQLRVARSTFLLLAVFFCLGPAFPQVDQKELDDLISHLTALRSAFRSVEATVIEDVKVNGPQPEHPPGTTSWGDRDSHREYYWAFRNGSNVLSFLNTEDHYRHAPLQETYIVDGGKQYTVYAQADKTNQLRGQASFMKFRGLQPIPMNFGYTKVAIWNDEVVRKGKWDKLERVLHATYGEVVQLTGATQFGSETTLTFAPKLDYLMVESRSPVHSRHQVLVDRPLEIQKIGRFYFPVTSEQTLYENDGSVYRTLTLRCKNLKFNQVDAKAFIPPFAENMIVTDSDKNIVYKFVNGKLVLDPMFNKPFWTFDKVVGFALLLGLPIGGILFLRFRRDQSQKPAV